MPKQFIKFKTNYIISRVEPCEAHWTEYYIGENKFHRGSNWTKHREYAKKYDNPIAAVEDITIYSLTGAKVEPTEIIGKETFVKEENAMPIKYVIRDYEWSESSRVSYIRKDQGKYNIYGQAWSTDPKDALEFDTAEEAKEFIIKYHLIAAHIYRRNYCTNREERIDKEDENKIYGTGTYVYAKSEQYSVTGCRAIRKIVDYREKTDEYVAMDANGKYYSIPSYEIIEPVTSDGIISAFEKRLNKKCQNDTFINCYCSADVAATTELFREMYKVKKEKNTMLPEIKKVIFNKPATIVFWADETKTVVRCREDEIYDPEKGLAMAIAKKALGNKHGYYDIIKHWLKKAPKVKTSKFYCNGVEYTSTKAGE